ncbi:MAG TPA: hypothetical protein VHN82_02410 [Methanoregula sp.]|nr:hypothetical protein [Methanoregula sp.]
MKTITVFLILCLCLSAMALPVSAANDGTGRNSGDAGPGQGAAAGRIAREINDTAMQVQEPLKEQIRLHDQPGNESEIPDLNRTRDRDQLHITILTNETPARDTAREREKIRSDRNALNATLRNATPVRAGWTTTGNDVWLAVHTLLAMENIMGGIGPQVSAVAREFNNSAQQSWQLEERIRNRDMVSRFFFGGDQVSAAELDRLIVSNQNRIRQIEQLMADDSLDQETRTMLQEQLAIMEQENTRLGQVSSAEQQNRGIFGWLGK